MFVSDNRVISIMPCVDLLFSHQNHTFLPQTGSAGKSPQSPWTYFYTKPCCIERATRASCTQRYIPQFLVDTFLPVSLNSSMG